MLRCGVPLKLNKKGGWRPGERYSLVISTVARQDGSAVATLANVPRPRRACSSLSHSQRRSAMKQTKLEVAIFNGDRVLVDVIEVSEEDYKTDPTRRQMALPQGHDVRGMIAQYKATPDYSGREPIIDKLDITLEVELAGWALARWQTVEEALFDIFAFLLRGSPNELLRPVFFRRDLSFRGRIKEKAHPVDPGEISIL